MLPSRVNPSQGTGTGFSLLLPSKAFPAADEKCSIPDPARNFGGQCFGGSMILVFSIVRVKFSVAILGQHFLPKLTSASYVMVRHFVTTHLVVSQRLAKWDPLATKGSLATLAVWLSTMVPVPHKIDAFKLYIELHSY